MHLANGSNTERPLSPHLGVYKWSPAMTTSIVHRVTGDGMATVGTILFVWWLVALANGGACYDQFVDIFTYSTGHLNALGYIFGVGLTWSLFQHAASGVRHLLMDTGANFELKGNKLSAILTFSFSVVATVAFWFALVEKLNG